MSFETGSSYLPGFVFPKNFSLLLGVGMSLFQPSFHLGATALAWLGLSLGLFAGNILAATDSLANLDSLPVEDSATAARREEAFEKSLNYRSGQILLGDGLARLHLDSNSHYLDPEDSRKVLVDLWGNPPGTSALGMIFPHGQKATMPRCWAVVISFDDDGYVKDDDAEKIDYDDLLKQMKKDIGEANEERSKAGYSTIDLVGWAEKPRYDAEQHKMYWAKELRFEHAPDNTLNYNVRILGRKGVLVLNAVSSMEDFPAVREGMQPLMQVVEFEQGHRYADFDPKIDKVAAYGIAGLVAGTVLAKAGLFKVLIGLLIAFKKVLLVFGAAAVAFLYRLFSNKREEKKNLEESVKRIDDERK